MWAFSNCNEWGPLFLAGHVLLIVVASPGAGHRPQAHVCMHARALVVATRGLGSCGSLTLEHGFSSCSARA